MCKLYYDETSPDGDVTFINWKHSEKKPDAYISRENFEEYRKKHIALSLKSGMFLFLLYEREGEPVFAGEGG